MITDLTLNDSTLLPAVGFGLFQVPPELTEQVVLDGVAAGYRLMDGAEFYANEVEVGRALAQVDRSDLRVASKFWGEQSQDRDAVLRSFDASEQALDGAGHLPHPLATGQPQPVRRRVAHPHRTA